MAKRRAFIPCVLRQLPEHLLVPAAQTAAAHNPANAPRPGSVQALLRLAARDEYPDVPESDRPMPDPHPAHIALLTQKYWGPQGKVIPTYFMDTQDGTLKNRLLAAFNSWDDNIKWVESSAGNALARIARQRGGGYWSYLGTDYEHIPADQPTMNLDSWALNMPESEWLRVPPHEAGHGRGFPHEHMRRAIVDDLDPEKTVAYFWQTYHWGRQEVQQQVLTPLDERSLMGTPADATSAMCYMLPASITRSGQAIPGGTGVNATDKAFAQKVYPRPDGPPPPPGGGVTITIPQAGTYRLVD